MEKEKVIYFCLFLIKIDMTNTIDGLLKEYNDCTWEVKNGLETYYKRTTELRILEE